MRKDIKSGIVVAALVLLLFLSRSGIAPPPTPHGVSGYIYNDDGSQVPIGINVNITNTVSGDSDLVQTYGPPIASGAYSASVRGNNDDLLIVFAWNNTHYGNNTGLLFKQTTQINVALNYTRSEPNVTIIIPDNHSVYNSTTVFQIIANTSIIGGAPGVGCEIQLQFSDHEGIHLTAGETYIKTIGSIALNNSNITVWNVTAGKEGSVNITINVSCDSDTMIIAHENIDSRVNITILDYSGPSIDVYYPFNSSFFNSSVIDFYYNATDYSYVQNCSLILDEVISDSNFSIQNGENNSFRLFVNDGLHNWSILCYDNSTFQNANESKLYWFDIDTRPPNVTALFPDGDVFNYSGSVTISANATDQHGISHVWAYIDWSGGSEMLFLDDSDADSNFKTVFNNSYVLGLYNISFYSNDSYGNVNYTETSYFWIKSPDLMLNSSTILFSAYEPEEGELVGINATVFNTGNLGSEVGVQFYDGDPDLGGVQIGTDQLLFIESNSSNTTNVSTYAGIGITNVFVVVDPPLYTNGSYLEPNETNNKVNNSFFVSSWQVFYGDVIGNILLGTDGNETAYLWNKSDYGGNIFCVDADSEVKWEGIIAIGKDISGENSSDDFVDIDVSLGMTDYVDSVNNSFNSSPRYYRNFSVFSVSVANVPIINSTKGSDFVTGILWDASDGGTEYNGSQDVIFIGDLQKDGNGYYGVYDYEIRIPALLREYVLGGSDLEFFVELH